jgi:hypothetical protein
MKSRRSSSAILLLRAKGSPGLVCLAWEMRSEFEAGDASLSGVFVGIVLVLK